MLHSEKKKKIKCLAGTVGNKESVNFSSMPLKLTVALEIEGQIRIGLTKKVIFSGESFLSGQVGGGESI